MKSSLADSATIVIPTRNRPEFLARLLAAYDRTAFPFPIHVEDSSDAYDLAAMGEWISTRLPNLRITYHPHDPRLQLPAKLRAAIARVKTPQMAFLADDDFYLPHALIRHAQWLEANPAAVAVLGGAYRFQHSPEAGVGGGLTWGRYPQRGLEDERAHERLARHVAYYTTNFYGLQRTSLLRSAWETAVDLYDDLYLGELALSVLLVSAGKIGCLEEPSFLRQRDAPKGYGVKSFYSWATGVFARNGRLRGSFPKMDAELRRRGGDVPPFAELMLRYAGSQLFCQSRMLGQIRRHGFRGLGDLYRMWRDYSPHAEFTRREVGECRAALQERPATPLEAALHPADVEVMRVYADAMVAPMVSPVTGPGLASES